VSFFPFVVPLFVQLFNLRFVLLKFSRDILLLCYTLLRSKFLYRYIYIEHHLWRKTKLNWFLHRRWSDIVKRALFSAYDGDSASKVNQIINLLGLLCVELSVNFRFLLSVPVSASHLRPVEKKEERIKIHFWRLIRTVSNYIPINIMQLWRAKNSKIIKNYVIKLSFRVLLFWYFRAWQDLDNVPKLFVLW